MTRALVLGLALLAAGCSGRGPGAAPAAGGNASARGSVLVAEFPSAPSRTVSVKMAVPGDRVAGYALRVDYDAHALRLAEVSGEGAPPLWRRDAASSGSVDIVQAFGDAPAPSVELRLSFTATGATTAAVPVVVGAARDGGIVAASGFELLVPEPISGFASVTP